MSRYVRGRQPPRSERQIPRREVDGVPVYGAYSTADVAAIVALIRTITEEAILSIGPATDDYVRYYQREIELDALPTDAAEVMAGYVAFRMAGGGKMYHVVKEAGTWAVHKTLHWIA